MKNKIPYPIALEYAAMSIVNHALELAGVSVETRQRINDECFDHAIDVIKGLDELYGERE